jgi:L-ascorbate metabolism protein UlaG (beta-lactamase superfamily)
VEITWYGLSCFRLRERGTTIICDPYDKKVTGLSLPRTKADIVTISHDRPGHNAVSAVAGEPKVFSGPGDYEVGGVLITGLTTYHKAANGEQAERNVAYFFDFDGFTVGHLGDLGQIPHQRQVEELGEIDVLLVPVSGHNTLDASRMTEVISLLEPRIVIPMHYLHPGLGEIMGRNIGASGQISQRAGRSRSRNPRLAQSNQRSTARRDPGDSAGDVGFLMCRRRTTDR